MGRSTSGSWRSVAASLCLFALTARAEASDGPPPPLPVAPPPRAQAEPQREGARVLPPEAGPLVERAFGRLAPAWILEDAAIDRDTVRARLCAAQPPPDCLAIQLRDPLACAGRVVGPWCVTYPLGAPAANDAANIERALAADAAVAIWQVRTGRPRTSDEEQRAVRFAALTPREAAELLAEGGPDTALPAGWQLFVAPPGPESPTFSLASLRVRGPAVELRLDLFRHAASRWATCSRNYCLDLSVPPPADLPEERVLSVLTALGRRLLEHDAVAAAAQPEATVWRLVLVVLFLFAFAGSLWTARDVWRAAPPPRAAWLGLLGVTGVALGVRLFVSPWAFQHEFGHINDALDLINGGPFSLYGEGGYALPGLLNRLFGGQEQTLFATNAVLATLTVPVVSLVDFALFGRWPRALCAGGIVAVLPQQLRFSASEVEFVPLVFFAFWGLLLVLAFVRRGSLIALLNGVAALFLAMQTRPEFALWPPLVLLLVLLTRPVRDWRILVSWRALVGGGALVGLFVLQRLFFAGESRPPQAEGLVALHFFAVLNPDATPPAIQLVFIVGMAWGLVRAWRATLWLLATAVGLTAFYLAFFNNEVYVWRTQLAAVPLYACLGAGAAQLLVDLLARWPRVCAVALCVLAGAIVSGMLSHRDLIRERLVTDREYAFARETLAALPSGPGVVLWSVDTAASAFPRALLTAGGHSLRFESVGVPGGPAALPPLGRRTVFYQGLYCYAHVLWERPVRDAEHPCGLVQRSCTLRPLRTATLEGRAGPAGLRGSETGLTRYEVGFYEVDSCRATQPQAGAHP